jgi:S1-C subfamily serine protease
VQYARLPIAQGVLVSEVTPGGGAEKAGLRGGSKNKAIRYQRNIIYLGGDVIIEADGLAVTSLADLYGALEDNRPGEVVSIKVNRNGEQATLAVQLSERGKQ